ncbi:MAG: hypothetical protein MUF52_13865 [Syntrophobacteraceae bacterium]|jgi:hypothetical protein|nr:hypothetical protein [Syntrophobacteraceae bacterium]
MLLRRLRVTVFLLVIPGVTMGCAALTARKVEREFDRPRECAGLYSMLDAVVREAAVRDASLAVVQGFPYLRVNRFLAALGSRATTEEEKSQWLDLMRRADLQSRRNELNNLSDADIRKGLGAASGEVDRAGLMERVTACSDRLYARDRSSPRFFDLVSVEARVPDEYSTAMRIVGLHPLASIPVAVVTERVRKRVRLWGEGEMDRRPVRGELKRYAPGELAALEPRVLEEWIRCASANPLSIPLLNAEQEDALLRHLAPELLVDVAGSYDRPGSASRTSRGPWVDTSDPALYTYISHGFLRGRPVLQCNYVVWFPERAGEGSPRIERGMLDGLTIRYSLDQRGRVFMVDIMNNCGCYHFFVPDPHAVAMVRSRPAALDPFAPQWLPELAYDQRLGVRINSGWHQVERLYAAPARPQEGPEYRYRLIPYEDLESHLSPHGHGVSLFSDRGIVDGSQRIEPIIFFPMGIHSIGSMRQRGHHAIDLIGREHFDSPRLFDERFIFR